MTLKPIDLGRQSNPGEFPHAGVARLINIRAVNAGEEGRIPYPLRASWGLRDFATLSGGGGVRAMLATEDSLYTVAGRVVFRTDLGGASTILGGIPSDGIVTMARNGRSSGSQIGIVCDGLYYMIQANTLSAINDSDLQPPLAICFLGGYFFYACTNGRWQWSELDQANNIDGLSFGNARVKPDGLLTCKARGRDLLLFGPQSIEVWYLNAGTGDAPVTYRSAISMGTLCAGGVVDVSDTVLFPATTDAGAFAGVRMMVGDSMEPISNPAVDRAFSHEVYPSNIRAMTWTEDGRTHVAWSGTDWTWAYDMKTQLWHERSSKGLDTWRVGACAQFGGAVIAGDVNDGALYTMAPDAYDEAGEELIVTLQPPMLHADPGRLELNELHLQVLSGTGLGSGASQDTNPQISLALSNDGLNWGTERTRPIGRQGQRRQRMIWTRFGTHPSFGIMPRFRASAAVAREVYGCAADLKVLSP